MAALNQHEFSYLLGTLKRIKSILAVDTARVRFKWASPCVAGREWRAFHRLTWTLFRGLHVWCTRCSEMSSAPSCGNFSIAIIPLFIQPTYGSFLLFYWCFWWLPPSSVCLSFFNVVGTFGVAYQAHQRIVEGRHFKKCQLSRALLS